MTKKRNKSKSKNYKKRIHNNDNKLMKTKIIFIYKHQKHNFLAFAA